MANLPARHRPNTHPAPSNCFQPSPNTSSRYHAHFSASDATSDRAIKVNIKRIKITPPRAISTPVLVSFEGWQSTPPSPQAASACGAGVRNAVDEEAEAQQQAPADDHSNVQRVHAIDDGGDLEAEDTGDGEGDRANKQTVSAGDAD